MPVEFADSAWASIDGEALEVEVIDSGVNYKFGDLDSLPRWTRTLSTFADAGLEFNGPPSGAVLQEDRTLVVPARLRPATSPAGPETMGGFQVGLTEPFLSDVIIAPGSFQRSFSGDGHGNLSVWTSADRVDWVTAGGGAAPGMQVQASVPFNSADSAGQPIVASMPDGTAPWLVVPTKAGLDVYRGNLSTGSLAPLFTAPIASGPGVLDAHLDLDPGGAIPGVGFAGRRFQERDVGGSPVFDNEIVFFDNYTMPTGSPQRVFDLGSRTTASNVIGSQVADDTTALAWVDAESLGDDPVLWVDAESLGDDPVLRAAADGGIAEAALPLGGQPLADAFIRPLFEGAPNQLGIAGLFLVGDPLVPSDRRVVRQDWVMSIVGFPPVRPASSHDGPTLTLVGEQEILAIGDTLFGQTVTSLSLPGSNPMNSRGDVLLSVGLDDGESGFFTLLAPDAAALAGDLNGDGFVGAGDLDILLGLWNQSVDPGIPADLTEDGFVGAGDLDILLGNWNATAGAAAVPEPTPAAWLLTTGAGLLRCRRGGQPVRTGLAATR